MKSIAPLAFALTLSIAPSLSFAQAKSDVLILGDSQISFGAGAIYQSFFKNIEQNCAGTALKPSQINKLGQKRTLAVGVRSTSLHSWVARSGKSKDTICAVDKKFGVNAGAYGIKGSTSRKFIQIGKEPGFNYCHAKSSAFEGVFRTASNTPDLLILNFLGNAEGRWANSQEAADTDVRKTLQQLPKDVPCVILTTAPVFSKATNDKRMTAQTRLERALKKNNSHCELVKGFTSQTRKEIEGKRQFFRQNKAGKVIDPHHPSKAAITRFIKHTGPKLCQAMAKVLR